MAKSLLKNLGKGALIALGVSQGANVVSAQGISPDLALRMAATVGGLSYLSSVLEEDADGRVGGNAEYGLGLRAKDAKHFSFCMGTGFKWFNTGFCIDSRLGNNSLTLTELANSSEEVPGTEELYNESTETAGNITKEIKNYKTTDITKTFQNETKINGFSDLSAGLYVEVNLPYLNFGNWGNFSMGHERKIDYARMTHKGDTTTVATTNGRTTVDTAFTNPITGEVTAYPTEDIVSDVPIVNTSSESSTHNSNEHFHIGDTYLKYKLPFSPSNKRYSISIKAGLSEIYNAGKYKEILKRAKGFDKDSRFAKVSFGAKF